MSRDFAEGFLSWRKLLAAMPDDERRLIIFTNAADDVATFVTMGLDRIDAADELLDMATAYGLDDTDAVQHIISEAFTKIEDVELVPDLELPGEEYRNGNGHDKQPHDVKSPPPPPPLLTLIDVRAWQGTEPKPRRWQVQDRIPAKNVTLLTGQGGIGKTLLMQQLAVATVLARDWIGVVPEPGPVLFITAEDDEDELHFRYDQIARHYGTDFNELADAGLNLLSVAGKDAVMAIADGKGIVRPTELFQMMVRSVRELRPRWIGLDTAADIFIINERDRSQVRQCISLLRGICLDFDTTIILLSHPSLTGISSGTGLSGSTAWNNSVRSRLYLKSEAKKDKDDEEEEADEGSVRVLEFMKSNYSALAQPVRLFWKNGLLLPETAPILSPIDRAAAEQRARDVFLTLLRQYNKQDRTVSWKDTARNYAPAEFSSKDEASQLDRSINGRKRLLCTAMNFLLDQGKIETGTGPKASPKSKQFPCLYAAGNLL